MTQYNAELVSQMSPPLTVEENLALIPAVAAGDKEARNRMIEGNMPLVISKVDTYVHFFPQYAYLRDDLTSAGFLGLVNAVNSIAEEGTKIAAPVDYIGVSIARELGTLAEETETLIRIPRETQRLATARGERIMLPATSSDSSEIAASGGEQATFEIRDLIESCCCCPEERTFVRMREAGHKLREIAEAINMPLSSMHLMKEGLYQRVLSKSGLKHIKKGAK